MSEAARRVFLFLYYDYYRQTDRQIDRALCFDASESENWSTTVVVRRRTRAYTNASWDNIFLKRARGEISV